MKLARTLVASVGFSVIAAQAMAEKPGMPQMDPTWFANQLVWLAISFVLLYTIVSRVIIPSVGGVLSTREATIAEAIAKAEAFKKNAADARGDFESRARAAHDEAAAIIAKAIAEAAQLSSAAMAKLDAELDTKTDAATAKLAQALQAAQPAMQEATAQVAHAIAEKLLGASIDAAAVSTAIKNAA